MSTPSTTLSTFLAFRNVSSPLRRGLSGGLIAGGVITFLILIGIPGGASDTDGLPAWFAWALFLLVALALGYNAARPHSVPQQRAQKPVPSLLSGLIVGLVAAVMIVILMIGINAAQLWEINLPKDQGALPSGLKSNITRVQDVLANVTPRTSAVLSGLPLDEIKPPNGQTRADPTGGFIKMSCLLLSLAAALGGGLSWFNTQISLRREYRRENASKTGQAPPVRNWVRWLPIALPVLFFAFIVFNAVPPAGAIGDDYRNLIGKSGQLLGLLAAFFTVGAGLVGVRSAVGERDTYPFALKAGVLILITVVFFVIGLAAPERPAGDLLFSQKTPNLTQIVGSDGKIQVATENVTPVDTEALLNYRRLAIGLLGLGMLLGNILGARGKMPLRSLIATNIMLCTLLVGPLYLDKYQQSVLLLVGINALLGMGLNIVVGYVGLLDLGYVSFFAIGAYTFAFFTSNQDLRTAGTVVGLKYGGNDQLAQGMSAALIIGLFVVPLVVIGGLSLWNRSASSRKPGGATPGTSSARPGWLGYALVAAAVIVCQVALGLLQGTPFYNTFSGFPVFIMGLLLSIIVAAVGGMLLGIPVLRLRGDYLAIVTLGFGEITRLVFNNLRTITGGPQGVITIPRVGFANLEMGSNEGMLYLVLICCLFVAFLLLRLKASRQGRAWGAVRAEEDIAQAMGINPFRAKVLGYALGAVMAAVGGVIFAIRQGSIFPDNFTLSISVNVLCLVIIGGMGSLPGVVVGALVLIGVPESLRVFENYRVMAFGALLIVMMLLRPQGILPQPPQPLARRAQELATAGKEQS
jgi:ABC-type branched-subunit amino acid transport system permease subunit